MSKKQPRRWRVQPDHYFRTSEGDVAAVSDDEFTAQILKAVPILQTMGGSLIVRTGRQPTDMVGEAVTTHAVCEWIPHVHASASIEDVIEEGSEQPNTIDVLPPVAELDEDLEPEPVEA